MERHRDERSPGRHRLRGCRRCGCARPVAAPEETTGQGRRTPIATGRPAGRRTRLRREDVQDDQPGPHRREAGSRLSAAVRTVGAVGTEDAMEWWAEPLGRDPVVGAAGGAVGGHRTDRCSRGLRADRAAWCSAVARRAPGRPVVRRSGGCAGPRRKRSSRTGSSPRYAAEAGHCQSCAFRSQCEGAGRQQRS